MNNIFWVIYDREVDKKLTLAVWDLDWTLGMDRDSQSLHGGRADPHHDLKFSSIELRMFSLPECVYHRDFIDRYWQLRKTWLSEKSLIERMNKAVDPLVESGAVAREQARWSGDSDINGLTLDIVAEKDFIIDWIKERLAYLDRTMMRHPCDVNGDGAVTAYDISMILSCLTDGTQTNVEDLDINGDGNVTAADLTRIYEYVLGL